MRYSVDNYAKAFMQAVKNVPPGQAVDGFIKLLKKTGDIKQSKKILEAVYRKLVHEKNGKWVNIETAREIVETKMALLKHKFSEKDHVDVQVNLELIAGVRITVNGEEELDISLRGKLNKLF